MDRHDLSLRDVRVHVAGDQQRQEQQREVEPDREAEGQPERTSPRHAARSRTRKPAIPAITPTTDAIGSASPSRSRPIASATHTNGPPGSAPGASTGWSGEPDGGDHGLDHEPRDARRDGGPGQGGRDASITPTLAPARR